jgi:transcriptional regulator with XRE-family HTH domain
MKRINPIDKHVGARLRMRRLMLHLTQSEVANGLGLTFQQLQKCENGKNRIGAGRLQLLCTILKVPVSFFFEGAPPERGLPDAPETEADGEGAALTRVLATSDGIALVAAYTRVRDPKVRRAIVALVEQITAEPESTVHSAGTRE